jgi:hypothetical protein
MSIAFPTFDSRSSLDRPAAPDATVDVGTEVTPDFSSDRAVNRAADSSADRATDDSADANPRVSDRRLAANRANARKSTGPRTTQGKRRVARNALKHGLCAAWSCLPSECEPTFFTFVAEIEEDLRPRTATQKLIFDQIVNLMWRLRRLPESQSKIFEQEMEKIGRTRDMEDENRVTTDSETKNRLGDEPAHHGEDLSPSDILARRFSDDPHNGFILMNRYERSLHSAVSRLMRQLEQLKRQQTKQAEDDCWKDGPPAREDRAEARKMSIWRRKQPAWTEEDSRRQAAWFAAHPDWTPPGTPTRPAASTARKLAAANDVAGLAVDAPIDCASSVQPETATAKSRSCEDSAKEEFEPAISHDVARNPQDSSTSNDSFASSFAPSRLRGRRSASSIVDSESPKQTHSPARENSIPNPPATKCPSAGASDLTEQTHRNEAGIEDRKCDNPPPKRYL